VASNDCITDTTRYSVRRAGLLFCIGFESNRKCPSKKLDHCFLGPFPIVEKVSSHAYRLGLSLALSRIHPVFHVSLLQPTSTSEVPNRVIDPPPPIELDDSNEWEVHQILDSRLIGCRKGSGLLYLVEWKGFDNTPMPPVRSHLNTWRMHPMWSEHSTGLIHISQPPNS